MNRTKVAFIIVFIILTGIIVYLYFNRSSSNKIGFIELNKVYLDFQMKKELEAQLKSVQEKRTIILDSLKMELQVMSRELEMDNGKNKEKVALFSVKRDKYYEKKKQFEDDNVTTAKMFDEQIFTQINQYIKDYGIKNDYLVILGAEGSGALMYAKEAINITEEVKKDINQRYKGKTN